jgi:hypothetical protein
VPQQGPMLLRSTPIQSGHGGGGGSVKPGGEKKSGGEKKPGGPKKLGGEKSPYS